MSTTTTPQTILVVRDEEVFATYLQHFPAARYLLLFAAGPAEAMALCESHTPRLMVVPMDDGGQDLVAALRAVDHAGGKILGVWSADPLADASGGTDRTVSADDTDALVAASRDLLQERRQHPRVVVEFPVWFGAGRQGLARDLNRQSLVIETTERLEAGAPLDLELHWGDEPRTIATTVAQVKPLDMGHWAIRLDVREEDQDARHYLEEVIRKILEVEHYLHALQPGRLAVRGPAAWNLARRAEESLRKTSELGMTTLGDEPPPPEQAPPDVPSGSLWTRYHKGASRGPWGTGEVFESEHRLLHRRILIKQLAQELRKDPAARTRMEVEATTASAVRSACIADVLDFGDDGEGGLFYAMEWLEGETLAEAMEGKTPFSWTDVARLGVHIAFALTAAHRQDVHHFDLCPEHIFLHGIKTGLATPKLLALGGPPTAEPKPPAHGLGVAFRPPGVSGETPSAQWDTFALCRILGRIQVSESTESGDRLRALCNRGTSSDATRRFSTMSSLCRALYQILQDLERAPASGAGEHIVPAVLPAEADLFRMSSTGLPIPSDVPPKMPWPRAVDRYRSDATLEAASEPEKPEGRLPTLPPTGRGPKSPSVKKTLYGVPVADMSSGNQPAEPASTVTGTASVGREAPTLAAEPEAATVVTAPEAPTLAEASETPTVVTAPEAPTLAEASEAPTVVTEPEAPTLTADSSAPTVVTEPAAPAPAAPAMGRTPSRAPKASPTVKKTLFGVAAIPPKPQATEAAPPMGAAAPGPAKPRVSTTAPGLAPLSPPKPEPLPAAPAAPAKGPRAAATAPAAAATVAPPPPAPASPALSPSELIASAIAEDIEGAAGSDIDSPLADGEAPIQMEVPLSGLAATASATSTPSAAASPRRRFPWLPLVVFPAALVGIAVGVYLGFFNDKRTDKPKKQRDTVARGSGRTGASGPVEPAPPRRADLAPRDAGAPARVAPADAGPHPGSDAPARDAAVPRDAASPVAAARDAAHEGPEGAMDEHPEEAHLSPQERAKRAQKRRLEARLALINKARTLMNHGKHAEARKFLTDALHMWDSTRLRTLFAQSYAVKGETWPAIHHQRRAVALAPQSVSAQITLGQLYLKVGQRGPACTAFRAARAAKPTNEKVQAMVKRYCGN